MTWSLYLYKCDGCNGDDHIGGGCIVGGFNGDDGGCIGDGGCNGDGCIVGGCIGDGGCNGDGHIGGGCNADGA